MTSKNLCILLIAIGIFLSGKGSSRQLSRLPSFEHRRKIVTNH
jgi:hypothetical protein